MIETNTVASAGNGGGATIAPLIITRSGQAIAASAHSAIGSLIGAARASLAAQGMEIDIDRALSARIAGADGGIYFIPFIRPEDGRAAWIFTADSGAGAQAIYRFGPSIRRMSMAPIGDGDIADAEVDIIEAIMNRQSAIDIAPRIGELLARGVPDAEIAPCIISAYRRIGAEITTPPSYIASKALWHAAIAGGSVC